MLLLCTVQDLSDQINEKAKGNAACKTEKDANIMIIAEGVQGDAQKKADSKVQAKFKTSDEQEEGRQALQGFNLIMGEIKAWKKVTEEAEIETRIRQGIAKEMEQWRQDNEVRFEDMKKALERMDEKKKDKRKKPGRCEAMIFFGLYGAVFIWFMLTLNLS
jgi:hypothetical protein